MTMRLACLLAALVLLSVARAEETKLAEPVVPDRKPLNGDYQVYGGTLSEMVPPTAKDRKVAFKIAGPLAKDLFAQIGPDRKDSCSADPDYRERLKGNLLCTHNKFGYFCYFGIDVVTGKGTYGVIC